ASTTVTVKAPEVIVSSPFDGATVNSEPTIVANGFSGNPVVSMQVYVDSALAVTVNAPSLNIGVAMAPGLHTLIIKGWDSAGRSFSKTLSVTMVNLPPTAALTLSSNSILVGGSITASTAGSSAPGGLIAKVTINFGDGTSAAGPSASHQYTAAGI